MAGSKISCAFKEIELTLPHNSNTPVHLIRPKWKDALYRLDPLGLVTGAMVLTSGDFALFQRGWPLSARLGVAVNRAGQPIPWYAYSAVDELERRFQVGTAEKPMVFEYGLGQSTLWWAKRARHVTVVEHDARWIKAYKDKLPGNVTLLHRHCHKGYEAAAMESGHGHDVVVIDGMNRPACSPHAMEAVKTGGLLIWDDSHYPRYKKALQEITQSGWTHQEFIGHGPVIRGKVKTTFFEKL